MKIYKLIRNVVIGLPAVIMFIIFGSMHYAAFLFIGFVFFPLASAFLLSHVLVKNIAHSKK